MEALNGLRCNVSARVRCEDFGYFVSSVEPCVSVWNNHNKILKRSDQNVNIEISKFFYVTIIHEFLMSVKVR